MILKYLSLMGALDFIGTCNLPLAFRSYATKVKNSNFNNQGSRLKALENNTFDLDILKSNPIREDQI